jgi:sulfide dehydrogenase cytochrome subunit
MSIIKVSTAIVIYFIVLASPTWATEVSGKMIAFSCSGCHGTDGQSAYPGIPALKSQPADKLEEKLLLFKNDKLASSIMGRITKGYTDTELKAVARYFSLLK